MIGASSGVEAQKSASLRPWEKDKPDAATLAALADPSQVQGAQTSRPVAGTSASGAQGGSTDGLRDDVTVSKSAKARANAPAFGEPELDESQKEQVEELKRRDAEVRAHERAHQGASGGLAGAAHFDYQKGPDGRMYAVGGEVGISSGNASTPEQTIQKMQTVRRAALAPADPSGQDRKVAAEATQREAQAREEATKQKAEKAKQSGVGNTNESGGPGAKDAEKTAAADERAKTQRADETKHSERQQAFRDEVKKAFGGETADAAKSIVENKFAKETSLARVGSAYQSASGKAPASNSTIQMIACANCGKAHEAGGAHITGGSSLASQLSTVRGA